MPRSGVNGTYNLPAGTDTQAPNTTISSSMFNGAMDDIEQAFNTATPVAYGGTGASTVGGALTNLRAVEQGGGTGMLTNKVRLGWDGAKLLAQVDATQLGQIWSTVVSPSIIAISGYQKLPNGLIIQWGRTAPTLDGNSNGSIVFPTAFPNVTGPFVPVYSFAQNAAVNPTSIMNYNELITLTSATFAVRPALPNTQVAVWWVAIGA